MKQTKRKALWIVMAVVCVMAFIVILFGGKPDRSHKEYVDINKTVFIYNDAELNPVLRDELYGRYSEDLDSGEKAAILPEEMPDWMACSTYARFSRDGELIYVEIQIPTAHPELEVWVQLGEECDNGLKFAGTGKPAVSQCGYTEYILYQTQYQAGDEKRFMLTAAAQINGYDILFDIYGNWKLEEQAKADFEAILKSFATYPNGEPNLAVILSDSEPVWYRKDLTMAEAVLDPDFGPYLPESLAEGTQVMYLYREKDRYMDSLQSVWDTEAGLINWNISRYDPEDERFSNCLVSVEDREKYDRSLYSLPWTSEISEEFRQTLESPIFLAEELTLEAVQARGFYEGSDRYVLKFSIVYENVRIYISAVNMEPEWVFEQIQNLLK